MPSSYIYSEKQEGVLDSIPSLTFNTIKTKLNILAFNSSRYLHPKLMLMFKFAAKHIKAKCIACELSVNRVVT